MHDPDALAGQFEAHRPHLRAVAYRMLGSRSEAEDAVQETWLRLNRDDRSDVENLGGWLTTVVSRVCLNMLQARRTRREQPIDEHLPDPVVAAPQSFDPEHEALMADAVGVALLVVLDTLAPAERLAFVLHDMFAVPFDEIAPIVDRSPAAARQLASRARRRVQGSPAVPDAGHARRRELVDAFLAAAREGDFEALLAVLDPDVVLRADERADGPLRIVRGAQAVGGGAVMFAQTDRVARPALVNGGPGVVTFQAGRPIAVMEFTVADERIVAIDLLADPERLARLELDTLGL
jgi:RNA polymerase sigma-70 factor (ECF subfamily)